MCQAFSRAKQRSQTKLSHTQLEDLIRSTELVNVLRWNIIGNSIGLSFIFQAMICHEIALLDVV